MNIIRVLTTAAIQFGLKKGCQYLIDHFPAGILKV